MKNKGRWILLSFVFVASVTGGYYLFRAGAGSSFSDATEVDWRLLADLDYVTGKAPPELRSLDGKSVKIPGFMVPLEDSQKKVVEFLLVPTPQACIHVPPPPPNQMVLVDMKPGHEANIEYGPIWIFGTLRLQSKRHQYGESSFTMEGLTVEPYR